MNDSSITPGIGALFVHPLKGGAPVAVQRIRLDKFGAVGDRRWMLVDSDGVVITPRETSRLAGIRAEMPMIDAAIEADGPLSLSAPGLERITLHEQTDPDAPHLRVRCWDDELLMADAGREAAEWCSNAIERECRVVHLTARSVRPLASRYSGPLDHVGRTVAVTDGAPLLLLGKASLDLLNSKLVENGSVELPVRRFRPNVLLDHIAPHEEDTWSRVRMGEVEIGVGSPCPRCVFTTVDPHTFERGVEPLRTLATYRRGTGGGVMFGMNATHAHEGFLHVGDEVVVLDVRS